MMDGCAATTSCTPRRTGAGAPYSSHVATVSTRYNSSTSILVPPTIPIQSSWHYPSHQCITTRMEFGHNAWMMGFEWALKCLWDGVVLFFFFPYSNILVGSCQCYVCPSFPSLAKALFGWAVAFGKAAVSCGLWKSSNGKRRRPFG
jgi:hypothetical protein